VRERRLRWGRAVSRRAQRMGRAVGHRVEPVRVGARRERRARRAAQHLHNLSRRRARRRRRRRKRARLAAGQGRLERRRARRRAWPRRLRWCGVGSCPAIGCGCAVPKGRSVLPRVGRAPRGWYGRPAAAVAAGLAVVRQWGRVTSSCTAAATLIMVGRQ
jgi:hypothetical protein